MLNFINNGQGFVNF